MIEYTTEKKSGDVSVPTTANNITIKAVPPWLCRFGLHAWRKPGLAGSFGRYVAILFFGGRRICRRCGRSED